jgi:hypothetical protein
MADSNNLLDKVAFSTKNGIEGVMKELLRVMLIHILVGIFKPKAIEIADVFLKKMTHLIYNQSQHQNYLTENPKFSNKTGKVSNYIGQISNNLPHEVLLNWQSENVNPALRWMLEYLIKFKNYSKALEKANTKNTQLQKQCAELKKKLNNQWSTPQWGVAQISEEHTSETEKIHDTYYSNYKNPDAYKKVAFGNTIVRQSL